MALTIKTEKEIEVMAEGGKILAEAIDKLKKGIRPGISTKELDQAAEDFILKHKGKCSFKGYSNSDNNASEAFPSCLCASINEEIVHALPSSRTLKEGDIISLDLGIFYKGYHSDMAITLPVGKAGPKALKLIQVAEEALKIGIGQIKPGNRIGDIGRAIQKYVESMGFSVVRELCGHGIGRDIHEDPQILNYGEKNFGLKIKEGMVLCLEPMVTLGDWRIEKTKDGFGYKTKDNSLSAHFEHTVALTAKGAKILTKI